MALNEEQLAAIKAFVPHIVFGAVCYALVIAATLRFRPSRRHRARLIGMLLVAVVWYVYHLPDFFDASGPPLAKWGQGGGGPRLLGDRLGIHTIWAWVAAAVVCPPRRSHESTT